MYSCIEKFKIPSFSSRSVMQDTVIASDKTERLYVQTIIILQKVLNAAVGITVMLYGLSQEASVYLLIVLIVMWH